MKLNKLKALTKIEKQNPKNFCKKNQYYVKR